MAKKNFKNFDEMNKFFNKNIASVMENEIAQTIKQKESEMVEQEVYQKYTPSNGEPWIYNRRRQNDGLADTRNMEHKVEIINDMVKLTVTNVTGGSDDANMRIANLVEHGDGNGGNYDYKSNRSGDADKYLSPRPFQARTLEELSKTSELKNVMSKALKARGINFKEN